MHEVDPEIGVGHTQANERKLGGEAPTRATNPTAPTAGMVRVELLTVVESGGGGHAALLLDRESNRFLPIFIGRNEALAISMRLTGQHFGRPLTHDLLEKVMLHAGVEVARVEIDALEDNTFLAHLYLLQSDGELARIDARPSDSMALAAGSGAPIYVAPGVLDRASVRPEELGVDPADLPSGSPPTM